MTDPPARTEVTDTGPVAFDGGSVSISGGEIASGRDTNIAQYNSFHQKLYQINVSVGSLGEARDGTGRVSGRCPYPGLRAFGADDSDFFFGRNEDILAVTRLVAPGVLVGVIGSSGSGKSSLLAAGVVPELQAGQDERLRWHAVTLKPGRAPLRILAERLTEHLPEGANAVELAQRLRADPLEFARLADRVAATVGRPVVWVVDQFEEVFDPVVPPAERDALLTCLRPGVDSAVILAMRSDFYQNLDTAPELARLVAGTQYRLLPLTQARLRAAVVGPAERAGLAVEPGLAEQIIADTRRGGGGAMPFVAAALEETWRRQEGGELTLSGYVQGGGVDLAIQRTADSVWATVAEADQPTARRILLRLAHVTDAGVITRRRCPATEFIGDHDDEAAVLRVLQPFVRARLLMMDLGEGGNGPTVEVAHETLLSAWPRLKGWIEADRHAKRLQDDLAANAGAWEKAHRDPAFLLTGARLAALVGAGDALAPNRTEAGFLAASSRLAGRQRRRSQLLVLLPLVLVVAVAVAGSAVVQERRTASAKRLSDALQSAAESRSVQSSHADLAALLAVDGDRTTSTPTTWGALVDAIGTPFGPTSLIHVSSARITTIGGMTAAGKALIGGSDGTVAAVDPLTGARTVLEPRSTAVAAITGSGDDVLTADVYGALRLSGAQQLDLDAGKAVTALALDTGHRMIGALDAKGDVHRWWYSAAARPEVLSSRIDHHLQAVALTLDGGGGLLVASELGVLTGLGPDAGPSRRLGRASVTATSQIRLAVTGSRPDRLVAVNGAQLSVWRLGAGLGRMATVRLPGAVAVTAIPGTADVLVATTDGEISRWSVSGIPARQATLPGTGGEKVRSLAAGPDRAIALRGSGTVVGWDLTGTVTPAGQIVPGDQGTPMSASFARDGTLGTGSADGAVTRLAHGDLPGEATRLGAMPGTAVTAVAWWGDRLVAGGRDGRVGIFRAGTAPSLLVAARSSPVVGLAAAGPLLAISWQDGRLDLIDAKGIRHPVGAGVRSSSLALSADGRRLAVGTDADAADVLLWDLQHPGPPRHLVGHRLFVSALAFSPDGSELASGGDDRLVIQWSIASGRQLRRLSGHLDTVRAVTYAPDGSALASAGDEGTVQLWDRATGVPVGRMLPVGPTQVLALTGSPDGRLLVAADGRKLVAFPFEHGSWQRRACAFAGRDLTAAERDRYLPGRSASPVCPSA